MILIIVFFLVFKVYSVSYERYQINKKMTMLDSAIGALNSRGDDLKALIAKFGNVDYIEKEARKKLNFQKPGEKPVIITKKSAGVKNNASSGNKMSNITDTKNESNLSLWINVFFGK